MIATAQMLTIGTIVSPLAARFGGADDVVVQPSPIAKRTLPAAAKDDEALMLGA